RCLARLVRLGETPEDAAHATAKHGAGPVGDGESMRRCHAEAKPQRSQARQNLIPARRRECDRLRLHGLGARLLVGLTHVILEAAPGRLAVAACPSPCRGNNARLGPVAQPLRAWQSRGAMPYRILAARA